jgi:hypothetical protein
MRRVASGKCIGCAFNTREHADDFAVAPLTLYCLLGPDGRPPPISPGFLRAPNSPIGMYTFTTGTGFGGQPVDRPYVEAGQQAESVQRRQPGHPSPHRELPQVDARCPVSRKATPSLTVGRATFVYGLVVGRASCSGVAAAACCRRRSKPCSTARSSSSLEG